MQKFNITRLLVMLFVLTLLAAGCAKKPAADESAITEQPTEVAVVEQQTAAVVEQQVDDAAARRAAAAAAAEAAAAKRAANNLNRIHFDYDQYTLTASAKQTLMKNANLLKTAPAVKVQIEGHCDERGSDEYNLALGEKRALATKNYLVSLGVSANRMSIISYGEEVPLDSSNTDTAWAKNRRAEFKAQR